MPLINYEEQDFPCNCIKIYFIPATRKLLAHIENNNY